MEAAQRNPLFNELASEVFDKSKRSDKIHIFLSYDCYYNIKANIIGQVTHSEIEFEQTGTLLGYPVYLMEKLGHHSTEPWKVLTE